MPTTPGNGHIFISHSHDDNDRCAVLRDALTNWGLDYWFDTERLDAGQDLSDRIQRAILDRDIFIRICSRAVQQHPYWVNLETNAFRALQAQDERAGLHGKRTLISLVLDAEYQLQPFELASLYIDAAHQQSDQWLGDLRKSMLHLQSSSDATTTSPAKTAEEYAAERRLEMWRTLLPDPPAPTPNPLALPPTPAPTPTRAQPYSRIVDWRNGEHNPISKAIAAARPYERILICAGRYNEPLVIDKPLEIVGDGALGDVVIEATSAHVIVFRASDGRIANLTLRQRGGGDWCGIDIARGRLYLENCDITSQSHSAVAIRDGADPRLGKNHLHDNAVCGVLISKGGRGVIENNDISANTKFGVLVRNTGSNPTLRYNRIHDNKSSGIAVADGGQGWFESNDIFANENAGISVSDSSSNPTICKNHIHENKGHGIIIMEGGQGLIDDNDIFSNANSGVFIQGAGSFATVRKNRITSNMDCGIEVLKGAGGTFLDNDLRNNKLGAWLITKESEDQVQQQDNLEK